MVVVEQFDAGDKPVADLKVSGITGECLLYHLGGHVDAL
jgi:hypothetical protein